MELVELHVADGSAGAPGHGDAVSCGDGWVGGVAVDLSCASAGDERGARMDGEDAALAVEQCGSGYVVVVGLGVVVVGLDDEIDAGSPLEETNAGDRADVAKKRDGDLLSGGVAVGVKDARARVRGFAGEQQLPVFAIEGRTPLEQLFDAPGALLDEDARGLGVDETVAGSNGVFQMERYIFVAAHGDGDAALRVRGVGFGERFFGDDEHRACIGEADGCAEAGDSGADDEEINMLLLCGMRGGGIGVRCCWGRHCCSSS